MRVWHELAAVARCPVNGETDAYAVTVETDRLIYVERILGAVQQVTVDPLSQEEFTQRLACAIKCTVTTRGTHSGVNTTVTCEP